jgi:hypothetical protein
MQYEEKSNLENRIIAHFDGSLDTQSSSSLLDEVLASPEKRALFRAHETLNSVIAAARVPMEAPLETKREIADRIPGLLAFLPGLLGTAETMPILQQSANPFVAFFARMSLQTAVSIGSAVAVLTTAGIIIKNNLDNTSAQPAAVASAQRQVPSNTTTQQYGMIPSQNVAASGMNSQNGTMSRPNPVSADRTNNNNTATSIASNGVSDHISASNHVAASNTIVASRNNVVSDNGTASANSSPTEKDNAPLVSNAFDAPRSAPSVASDIPVTYPKILTPMPAEVGEGITVRPYASSGYRLLQLNPVSGVGSNVMVQNSVIGFEFELGDRYAFRAQGGQSSFAQIGYTPDPSAKIVSVIAGLKAYSPTTIAQSANWATVGMSYSIPITASIPIILSADVGTVFLNPNPWGIMGIFGAAADIPVSSNFTLRPLLTFDMVSSSTQSASMPTGNIVIENSIDKTSMVSQAFGLQLNLMYRF